MDSYIYPSLNKLHDPRLMKGYRTRSRYNKRKIKAGKNTDCWDYDQDGNSAILTLYKGMKRWG